jgi:hypothetical protein
MYYQLIRFCFRAGVPALVICARFNFQNRILLYDRPLITKRDILPGTF